jgi:hypothetical protein
MKTWHSYLTQSAGAGLIVLATLASSCREATVPTAPPLQTAKGGGSGSPTVSSVVPDSSERGVTRDITVNGSGFDQGSAVRLERAGGPVAGT